MRVNAVDMSVDVDAHTTAGLETGATLSNAMYAVEPDSRYDAR